MNFVVLSIGINAPPAFLWPPSSPLMSAIDSLSISIAETLLLPAILNEILVLLFSVARANMHVPSFRVPERAIVEAIVPIIVELITIRLKFH